MALLYGSVHSQVINKPYEGHKSIDFPPSALIPQVPKSLKDPIIYQFPKDRDLYVQPQTTLILHLNKTLGHFQASDLSFIVKGDLSGIHLGKIVTADDQETVIFKPDIPFTLGENVRVTFTWLGADIPGTTYSFRITSMTESEQAFWRKNLSESEERKNKAFRDQADLKRPSQEIQQVPSDTLPWYFPQLTVDRNFDGSDSGYVFLGLIGTATAQTTVQFAFVSISDNTGSPLFFNEIGQDGATTADFRLQSNNTLTYPDVARQEFYEMDLQYKVIDSFKCGNGLETDTHDIELLPNGGAMLVAVNPVLIDNVIVYDNVIQILDGSKNVIFQWNALDHFKMSDETHEDTTLAFLDFAHINSIQTDTDGNIIASFRNMDEVTKIGRDSGNIIWRWGGKHNEFTFLGDTLQFSHQHHVRRIKSGHITMMDNGDFHSIYSQGIPTIAPSSRAMEYDLDEIHHTATAFWQFTNLPYINAAGSVQRLDNGNTFIGMGNVSSPCAMEVTSGGDVVFQLSLPHGTISYRAYRFKIPNLAAVQDAGQIYSFGIENIYPNPALNATTITFFAVDQGLAKIELINVLGHTVRTLTQKISGAGKYSFDLEVHDLPSGMYFCRLYENGESAVKMVIVRK